MSKFLKLVLFILGLWFFVFAIVDTAKSAESMTCDQFELLTKGVQKSYLITEVEQKINPTGNLNTCIRRNGNVLRDFVVSGCDYSGLFSSSFARALRRIRSDCVMAGEFDVDLDVWEDLEIPYSYFPRP